MLNKQEIFDRITKHLLTQNKKAQWGDSDNFGHKVCQYKTKDNLKCAIGCLIEDSILNTGLQGTVYSLEVQAALCKSLMIEKLENSEVDFLRTLQKIHDVDHESTWEEQLKQFASRNNLTFGVTNG